VVAWHYRNRREGFVAPLIVLQRQSNLLQIVAALGAAGRLARHLNGGQEQSDQDADDSEDHQQFD
jgi:hypothetical protein